VANLGSAVTGRSGHNPITTLAESVGNDPIPDFRAGISLTKAVLGRADDRALGSILLLPPASISLRQTRLAQTLGNALKLGKEDGVVGPPLAILQPLGNGVVRPEPTKLGDGGVSFTLMSR
jgi:hypothetical protein